MSSKNEQAYQLIRSKLFSGMYVFGSMIAVKALSEETGLSRQPIMTALYRLQEQGFVTITAQVGCHVVKPSLQEVMDFYEMFAAVEGVISRLAAQRANKKGIEKLQAINHAIAELDPTNSKVAEQYRLLNVEFHLQIQQLAKSPQICLRQQANFDLSDFYLAQTHSFNQNLAFASLEHQQIIEAISDGDAHLATELGHKHILSVAHHLKTHSQDYFLD